MSDRTQTLSVGRSSFHGVQVLDATGAMLRLGCTVEHQGFGYLTVVGFSTETPNATGATLYVRREENGEQMPWHVERTDDPNVFRTLALTALSQPEQGETPSLALSDKDRERLEEIAVWIEASGSLRADHEARFLRNLASQEHRGEGRIAQLEALEPGWDSYGGKAPTAEALGRLRGFDRALSYVPMSDGGIQVEFHALGLDFEAVINPAGHLAEYDLEPSTGEAARLRERLLDDDGPVLLELREAIGEEIDGRDWRTAEGGFLHPNDPEVEAAGNDVSDRVKSKLAAVLPAAVSAPSDSQGEQELATPEENHGQTWRVDGDTLEVARKTDRTMWVRRVDGPWHRLSDLVPASVDPASTQGEAPKDCERCGNTQSVPGPVPCPDCCPEQYTREGGDEEDWPATIYAIRGADGKILLGRWVGDDEEFCRYVPATQALPAAVPSEPSVLEELAADFEARAERSEVDAYSSGLQSAATTCREKAAALKGGEAK